MELMIPDEQFSELIEEDCSEEIIEPRYTTEHLCSNDEYSNFTCFHCFEKFQTNNDLLQHIENEHFSFVCDKCEKHFPTDKRLKKHQREAHLPAKFSCPFCGKVFTRNDQCKDHMYIHSGKALFLCKHEKCGKSFQQSLSLKQHERTHSQIYRKTCPICEEQVVYLSKHMKTHLKIKQHPCSSCDKSFTRRSYLAEHQKIHLGEVGFVCDLCQDEFKSSNALYKHKRSKHNAEQYICELPDCRQTFNRKDNMVSHMRRKHNLEIEAVKN